MKAGTLRRRLSGVISRLLVELIGHQSNYQGCFKDEIAWKVFLWTNNRCVLVSTTDTLTGVLADPYSAAFGQAKRGWSGRNQRRAGLDNDILKRAILDDGERGQFSDLLQPV